MKTLYLILLTCALPFVVGTAFCWLIHRDLKKMLPEPYPNFWRKFVLRFFLFCVGMAIFTLLLLSF